LIIQSLINDFLPVVNQDYIIEAQNDHVYALNYGILKCYIPFGTEYFNIISWMDSDEEVYSADSTKWGRCFRMGTIVWWVQGA